MNIKIKSNSQHIKQDSEEELVDDSKPTRRSQRSHVVKNTFVRAVLRKEALDESFPIGATRKEVFSDEEVTPKVIKKSNKKKTAKVAAHTFRSELGIACDTEILKVNRVASLAFEHKALPRYKEAHTKKLTGKWGKCVDDYFEVQALQTKACPVDIEIRYLGKSWGYGVFTAKEIPKGTIVGEYIGEIVWSKSVKDKTYLYDFPPQDSTVGGFAIDAAKKGNWVRFVNHGKTKGGEANIEDKTYYGTESPHIFYIAKKMIPKGAQLLVDYGDDYWENLKREPDTLPATVDELAPIKKGAKKKKSLPKVAKQKAKEKVDTPPKEAADKENVLPKVEQQKVKAKTQQKEPTQVKAANDKSSQKGNPPAAHNSFFPIALPWEVFCPEEELPALPGVS